MYCARSERKSCRDRSSFSSACLSRLSRTTRCWHPESSVLAYGAIRSSSRCSSIRPLHATWWTRSTPICAASRAVEQQRSFVAVVGPVGAAAAARSRRWRWRPPSAPAPPTAAGRRPRQLPLRRASRSGRTLRPTGKGGARGRRQRPARGARRRAAASSAGRRCRRRLAVQRGGSVSAAVSAAVSAGSQAASQAAAERERAAHGRRKPSARAAAAAAAVGGGGGEGGGGPAGLAAAARSLLGDRWGWILLPAKMSVLVGSYYMYNIVSQLDDDEEEPGACLGRHGAVPRWTEFAALTVLPPAAPPPKAPGAARHIWGRKGFRARKDREMTWVSVSLSVIDGV